MTLTRKQLRKIILEVYKPGIERKIQRASVMDPDMLQNIDDLETSGVEGRRQAQDLALAMGSEEDEVEFIDSQTYSDIVRKNKPYKFFDLSELIDVLLPIQLSACASKVVGIKVQSMPRFKRDRDVPQVSWRVAPPIITTWLRG